VFEPTTPQALPLDALPDHRIGQALRLQRWLRGGDISGPFIGFRCGSPLAQAFQDLRSAGAVRARVLVSKGLLHVVLHGRERRAA
jgi:hypothetical protein